MTRKYALVIGIQKYDGPGFCDLEKPVEDAEAIAQILEAHGDFVEVTRLPSQWNDEKRRFEMIETQLLGTELEESIINFFEKVGSNEALIYFSGHGSQVSKLGRKKGYLIASDCTADTVAMCGIALEDLNGLILDATFSNLVVLLDCCHSGSFLEQSQISTALGAFRSGDRNYFLATACRSYEDAYEGAKNSVFTTAVLKALRSPGSDGRVRTSKLNQVIDEELRGSGQEPVVLKSGGEITLVTYPATGRVEEDEPDKLQTALEKLRPDYEILDASFFETFADKVAKNQARTQILKLQAANWSMLFQKNYVERDQQGEALEKALRLSQEDGISLLLIRGELGAGKSALLRWLAYELFGQVKRVFHKKTQGQFGWLEQLREFSEQAGREHFYVIVDDLFRDELILEELQQNEFLFPLTLIGTTRQNEDRHTELQGSEYETVCLDLAKPSAAEKERVLVLPEVQVHLAGKSTAERQQLMDSPTMLVLMLQLSEGKSFDLLLWDVIKNLPHTNDQPLYQAFGVLCSFFQYGIVVPFEILRICLPVSSCSEQSILSGLEGLIDTATDDGYEGLTSVHELIAKTVMALNYRPKGEQNQPYAWIDCPPLLEKHLKEIFLKLDATQKLQKCWTSYSLRKLATTNKEVVLVRKVLRDYSQQIEAIQQQNTLSEWSHWARIYAALNLLKEQQRCIRSILLTQPNSSWEWGSWLSLIQKLGSRKQQQEAIVQTRTWLDKHLDDWDVRNKYLALVEQCGSPEQKQAAIAQTQTWLSEHPKDLHVRTKYLALVGQCASREQKQAAITQTQHWLDNHPDNGTVRTKYLALVQRCGNREQQQAAITQTQSWLDNHPDDWEVRTKYLSFVGKTSENSYDTEVLIHHQWQWIIQQHQVNQGLWQSFLPVFHDYASPDLYPLIIERALQQHPESGPIACQVFRYFRDYLDYTTCYKLATRISQVRLSVATWHYRIYAANFFRDHDELDTAKKIYSLVISDAKNKVKKFPDLLNVIDFANLSYAQLLLLNNPPQPDQALQKLRPILEKNPQHSYAHLLMAKSYQTKGKSFDIEAKEHFKKAIQFDLQKRGFFHYQFGCFFRYTVSDIPNARRYFEESLSQKLNLPASLELAELEATNNNLEQAKTLLQNGLDLIPITRPEKEEREKLRDRIIALRALLDMSESCT